MRQLNEALQFVLTLGDDVKIQANENWTALLRASKNGHTEVIEQLLKQNADVNIQNRNGGLP